MLLNRQIDVTSILPNVRVPTLVLYRRTNALVPIERGELAALIPNAKFIKYPEGDHVPFTGNAETIVGDIQEFVTEERESSASNRPGQGLNDNSLWSKFRNRRNLGRDKAVIWRASVDCEREHVGEDFSFGRF